MHVSIARAARQRFEVPLSPTSPPVVLVHGYLSARAALWPIQWRLRRRGFDPWLVRLEPLVIGDVRRMARQLDRGVERVRARTGAERVDVVGMSLGGLIGLYWLRHLDGARRARRFVAVGCPFQGTWAGLLGVAALGLVSAGAWQVLPGSRLLKQLVGPAPVPTTSIAIEGDLLAPPSRCWLEGAELVVLPPAPVSALAHQWLILHDRTLRTIADVLRSGSPP